MQYIDHRRRVNGTWVRTRNFKNPKKFWQKWV